MKDRKMLDQDEICKTLTEGKWASIAIMSVDGWPCVAPFNYGCCEGHMYIRCQPGFLTEAVTRDPRTSFMVVVGYNLGTCPENAYLNSLEYNSVIGRGKASIVQDEAEKEKLMNWIAGRYKKGTTGSSNDAEWGSQVIDIKIDEMTGQHNKFPIPEDTPIL